MEESDELLYRLLPDYLMEESDELLYRLLPDYLMEEFDELLYRLLPDYLMEEFDGLYSRIIMNDLCVQLAAEISIIDKLSVYTCIKETNDNDDCSGNIQTCLTNRFTTFKIYINRQLLQTHSYESSS